LMQQTEIWETDTYSIESQVIQQNDINSSGLLAFSNKMTVCGEV
jgi:hypothetical protein